MINIKFDSDAAIDSSKLSSDISLLYYSGRLSVSFFHPVRKKQSIHGFDMIAIIVMKLSSDQEKLPIPIVCAFIELEQRGKNRCTHYANWLLHKR